MKAKIRLIAMAMIVGVVADASVVMDWVTVGNPGNAADTADGDQVNAGVQNFGSVAYTYRISAYEVTNDQYVEFLNAADPDGTNPNSIYNSLMETNPRGGISFNSGATAGSKYSVKANMGNKPVNYVSFLDSMRFVNWLENGQGTGDTESGVYTIGTGLDETRSGTASYFLPSEDEWYKAAYHDPVTAGADDSGTTDYWLYPTQSDTLPTLATADATGDITNPGSNVANRSNGADWNSMDGNVTTVGDAGATSYYGGFDLGGNVIEWNEAIISGERGVRGGGFSDGNLSSSIRGDLPHTFEGGNLGFRVAAAAVPEPGTLGLIALSSIIIYPLRRRKFSAA